MHHQLAVLFEEYEERLQQYVGSDDGFVSGYELVFNDWCKFGLSQEELCEPFAEHAVLMQMILQADELKLLQGKPPQWRRGDQVQHQGETVTIDKLIESAAGMLALLCRQRLWACFYVWMALMRLAKAKQHLKHWGSC